MKHEVVDFRKPGRVPDDIALMLSQWQSAAREAVELRWGRCIASGVKVGVVAPRPLIGSDLRTYDMSAITYRMDIQETGSPTLVVIDRSLALALVSEMLGASTGTMPEARELTNIETTCLDYLVEEFRAALQSSQKLKPARRLAVIDQAPSKELYAQFPENVTNTDVGFKITLAYGSELVRWVLPQEVTLDFVGSFATGNTATGETRKALERLLLNAPANLKVQLGAARIPLAKLAGLKPGDIIVLNQTIDEPLVAEFGGQPLFRGWGGRIGKQQAFQIEDVFDGQTDQ